MQNFELWLKSVIQDIPDAHPELFNVTKQQFEALYQQHLQEGKVVDQGTWWSSLAQHAQAVHGNALQNTANTSEDTSEEVLSIETVNMQNFSNTSFNQDVNNRFTNTVKNILESYGSNNKT